MLLMVTAGFYDRSHIALRLFQAIGEQWDEMEDWVSGLWAELFPQTCTWSVGYWENLYGIRSEESLSLSLRRQQVMARVLYQAPMNPETVRRGVVALTGCEDVVLEDFVAPYTFHVTVNHPSNLENMADVWGYLWEMKPSHLSFRLFFQQETLVVGDSSLSLGGHYASVEERNLGEVSADFGGNETMALGASFGRVESRCLREFTAGDYQAYATEGSYLVTSGLGVIFSED